MEHRPLGNSGISTPTVVLGTNVFGWTVDQAQSFRLLDATVDQGLNALDTADVYSTWGRGNQGGESETIIGNWIKQTGKRDQVLIMTKCGSDMGNGRTGLSRNWIMQAVDDSLRRLQTDYIDLYQAHRDDLGTPLDETLQAFADLIAAGKVRAIGASNYAPERFREALATSARLGIPRYETMQPLYNLMERGDYENGLEPICAAENVGVINYSALASGFLTGKYRSEADLNKSPRGGGVKKYLDARGHGVLATLDEIAAAHDATPAQVALAWLIARPSITAPIASATSEAQLADLVKAADLTLAPDEIAALDRASA